MANAIERQTKGELKEIDLICRYDFELATEKDEYTQKNTLFYETLLEFVDPGLLEVIVSSYTRKKQAQEQEA